MYKVIKFFTDLQDGSHPYQVGDTFPRSGLRVSKARFQELSSPANKQGVPLIEEVIEDDDAAVSVPKKLVRSRSKKAVRDV